MRTGIKWILLPLMALILMSCSLFTPGGPLVSPPTGDPVQETLTAMAPTLAASLSGTQAAATLPVVAVDTATSAPSPTNTPAQPTAAPTNTVLAQAAPTATSHIPVVQITPIYSNPNANPNPVYPTAAVIPANPAPSLNLIRVNFFANATSANLVDNLTGGQTKNYVLRVMAGQVMMVNLDSPNQDVFLRIFGLNNGQIFLDSGMGAGQRFWQGRLPLTQDYVIQAISRGSATSFNLGITIPENLVFQPGAVSGSRSYPIRPRETHTFLLRAAAGQTMTLTLTPNDQSVLLAFYGYQDGQPYLRTVTGQTSWSGQVPATQDYVVQVVSVVDNATVNFKLDVLIQ